MKLRKYPVKVQDCVPCKGRHQKGELDDYPYLDKEDKSLVRIMTKCLRGAISQNGNLTLHSLWIENEGHFYGYRKIKLLKSDFLKIVIKIGENLL